MNKLKWTSEEFLEFIINAVATVLYSAIEYFIKQDQEKS